MRKANITLALIAVLLLVGFTTIAIKSGATTHELNYEAPKLQSTEAKLKTINVKYEKLNTQLNQKTSNDQKTIDNLKKQQDQLQKEREDLKHQVQAKAEEKQRIADAATNAANALTATQTAAADPLPAAAPAPVAYSGSHEDMMAAAGIPASDYAAVDFIVSHESGWNASAVNSGSGSCGLIQELPCGKSGCAFADGVCQLRWATTYATGRYGSWWGAYSFWSANRWW